MGNMISRDKVWLVGWGLMGKTLRGMNLSPAWTPINKLAATLWMVKRNIITVVPKGSHVMLFH